MGLDEIIKEKLSRLQSVPDEFLSQLQKVQKQSFTTILDVLSSIKVDAEGVILPGQLAKIEEVATALRASLFYGDYLSAVNVFVKEFYGQKALTIEYFTALGEFSDNALYEDAFNASINSAVDLLNGNSIDQQFIKPVKDLLTQSMTTKTGYTEMVSKLSDLVAGGETGGLLEQYIGLIARDSFAVTDRTYTNVISGDIGYEYFLYSGGELKTSREFCTERHGEIFHKSEIESWASEDWQGKNPDTTEGTIFVLVGGYNCIHSLLPVPTDEVPQEVLDRTAHLR